MKRVKTDGLCLARHTTGVAPAPGVARRLRAARGLRRWPRRRCATPVVLSFVPAGASGVLVGAGDIGFCGTPGAEATARLLDRISGTVFTAGDNAYMSGTRDEFRNCYGPSWGRHLSRTRPARRQS